jgi:two-component system, NtrC family, sensor histidine kinase HydH
MTISEECAVSQSETISLVHDLRTSLSTIHGSAELLVSSEVSEAQVRRLAQNLYKASLRMNELIEECLIRHRRTEQPENSCHVRGLVEDAVEEVCVRAQLQSVQICDSVSKDLVIVADRLRMRRVLVNLLVNALDVMPGGGRIAISAVAHSQNILIKVSDTGPGVAPESRGRLFQPFATAGKANGIGLGLACSRRAVIDHGGEMWAESPSIGACFVVCLPRALGN